MGDKLRALPKIAGIAGVGVVVLVISFVLSFPYDQVKDYLIRVAAGHRIDLQVGHAGPILGFGMKMEDVFLRTRPEPGKKPMGVSIEKAKATVSPLAQLRGIQAVDLDIDAFGGTIEADLSASPQLGSTRLAAEGLSMAQLPGLRESINLPAGGTLDLEMDLKMPNNRNGEAFGPVQWSCASCSLGDGKAKLRIAGNPLLTEGVSLPKINLGDFLGKITFEKGVGRLQGVHAKSADGELFIEGEIRLADPLPFTHVDIYVRFRFADAFLAKAEKLKLMMEITESMGKRPDGFYGFRMTGPVGRLGPIQWMKASPFPSSGRASTDKQPTPHEG